MVLRPYCPASGVRDEKAKKPPIRLDAVARENERAVVDLIRRWQALPVERRTGFLRKRVGVRRSAL